MLPSGRIIIRQSLTEGFPGSRASPVSPAGTGRCPASTSSESDAPNAPDPRRFGRRPSCSPYAHDSRQLEETSRHAHARVRPFGFPVLPLTDNYYPIDARKRLLNPGLNPAAKSLGTHLSPQPVEPRLSAELGEAFPGCRATSGLRTGRGWRRGPPSYRIVYKHGVVGRLFCVGVSVPRASVTSCQFTAHGPRRADWHRPVSPAPLATSLSGVADVQRSIPVCPPGSIGHDGFARGSRCFFFSSFFLVLFWERRPVSAGDSGKLLAASFTCIKRLCAGSVHTLEVRTALRSCSISASGPEPRIPNLITRPPKTHPQRLINLNHAGTPPRRPHLPHRRRISPTPPSLPPAPGPRPHSRSLIPGSRAEREKGGPRLFSFPFFFSFFPSLASVPKGEGEHAVFAG